MTADARSDVLAFYRLIRRIGLGPVKATEAVVDKYAQDIAHAVDRAAEADAVVQIDASSLLLARWRLAREWQRQAVQLAERRLRRHLRHLDTDPGWPSITSADCNLEVGHADTVWVPLVGIAT